MLLIRGWSQEWTTIVRFRQWALQCVYGVSVLVYRTPRGRHIRRSIAPLSPTVFMSKFHCGRVFSIELAIATPVILCRFWNPKNSSWILPSLSTKRMTSDSCSLFEASVTSSGSSGSIKNMEHQIGFDSLCFLVFALLIYWLTHFVWLEMYTSLDL